jgi:hypothetical protein
MENFRGEFSNTGLDPMARTWALLSQENRWVNAQSTEVSGGLSL